MKGYHYMINAYHCNDNIKDKEVIRRMLIELPEIIDMNRLSEPFITDLDVKNPGVSGFVVIAESHIAIHTFNKNNILWLDVFSCKPFSEQIILNYIKSCFSPKLIKPLFIKR